MATRRQEVVGVEIVDCKDAHFGHLRIEDADVAFRATRTTGLTVGRLETSSPARLEEALRARDTQALLQAMGFDRQTPPTVAVEALLEVAKPGRDIESVTAALSRSRFAELLGKGADFTTIVQGLVQITTSSYFGRILDVLRG